MIFSSFKSATLAVAFSFFAGSALADPVNIEAVMAPTDVIRMDFKDGSKHFVAMVRREGNPTGTGLVLLATFPNKSGRDPEAKNKPPRQSLGGRYFLNCAS